MKLAVGTRLGPYQIQQTIGAGGMGVVYSADDSRLGRKVAIKVLPEAHGDHLKRFEREARTIGSLNHPNLLTLHDIGEHDGSPYLVTELLDGESLRVRLQRGKLRLREAIQIAAEVARGLAAAHGAGVIHRDIKPDNIFLTTDGRTKILDFGIAKLMPPEVSDRASRGDFAHDPTLEPSMPAGMKNTATTQTGVMIGTPGYMAPEQLDGGTIDERTDIFALGVVFYEMLSGARAFASDSPIEESYAILKHTPEPPKGATKAVARVVLRCLEKRPEARFQSADDLAFALDELDASTDPVARIPPSEIGLLRKPRTEPHPVVIEKTGRGRTALAVGILLGVAAGAGVAGALIGRTIAPSATAVVPRWPSLVEGGPAYSRVTYQSQTTWHARLAPDGKSALYSIRRDAKAQVVRSQLAQPSILPLNIAGRVADVSRRGELAVILEEVDGGGGTLSRVFEGAGPRALADHVTAASWLADGESLAIIRDDLALESPIGTTIVKRTSGKLGMLRAAPSGDRFAFADHPASKDTRGKVVVVDRVGKQLVTSSEQTGIEGVAWSPDGTEVWYSNGPTVYGLDREGRERVVLRGSGARLVLADVAAGKILVAPSDVRLKMFNGPRGGPYREVSWFDSSEVESVSADGATIAFVEAAGTGLTAAGYAHFMRRADQPAALIAHGFQLALLPDASAGIMVTDGGKKLMRVPTGVGTPTPVPSGGLTTFDIGDAIAMAWSGRYIVVRGSQAGAPMRLWRIDLDQAGAPIPIEVAHESGRHPISSDGSLVAVAGAARGVQLVSLTGAAPRMIDGPTGEQPISFTRDAGALFVMHEVGDTIAVDRLELATGARTNWMRIAPEQRPVYYAVALDATGELVTYSTNSDSSDLYVLEPPAR